MRRSAWMPLVLAAVVLAGAPGAAVPGLVDRAFAAGGAPFGFGGAGHRLGFAFGAGSGFAGPNSLRRWHPPDQRPRPPLPPPYPWPTHPWVTYERAPVEPVVVVAPSPVPGDELESAAPVPPPPPDPRGPFRGRLARGVVPAPPPFSLGEPLPAGVPHVSLDWRLHDLPEPPPGLIYARVGRSVLLITAAGRIVREVVSLGESKDVASADAPSPR